jgi:hypothetical protein
MESFALTVMLWIAMVCLSLVAALRMPSGARVPMQWDFRGKPIWTAPVWLAVSFTPAVAVLILAVFSLTAMSLALPSLASLFLGIHALHLFFGARHVALHGGKE